MISVSDIFELAKFPNKNRIKSIGDYDDFFVNWSEMK